MTAWLSKPMFFLHAASKQDYFMVQVPLGFGFWLTHMMAEHGDMTTLCPQYDSLEGFFFSLDRYFIDFYQSDLLYLLERVLTMTKPFLTAQTNIESVASW